MRDRGMRYIFTKLGVFGWMIQGGVGEGGGGGGGEGRSLTNGSHNNVEK